MHITDNILTINGTEIELPRLSADAKVRAWSVPTAYRTNGYFVTTTLPGQPFEHPACGNEGTAFVGELEYPADAGALLQAAKRNKHADVDAVRDDKIAAGVPYIFPGDVPGTVQTRDLTDHRNIQANASAAQMYIINSQPDAPMQFRDMEDVVHTLTATEMAQMCAYVMGYGQAIYSASWAHKTAIDALGTVEAVEAYDVTIGWPG